MTPNNYQNLISSVLQAPTVIAFRVRGCGCVWV